MKPSASAALGRATFGQLDLWLFILASWLALMPFHRSFVSWSFLGTTAAAVVVPAIVSVLTARRSHVVALCVLVVASLVVLVLVVYPDTLRYGLPLDDTASGVGHGLAWWWRDFLTSAVPGEATATLLAAPVVLGLLGSSATALIVVRTGWTVAPALPPILVLGVATAFSPGGSMLSVALCASFLIVLLLALAVRG